MALIPSILFEGAERRPRSEALAPPDFFADLNLDQIVAAVIAGKDEYNLTPFFYAALHDVECGPLPPRSHARSRRRRPAGPYQRICANAALDARYAQTGRGAPLPRTEGGAVLDAVDAYCGAVAVLTHDLGHADLRSRGFVAFRDYLADYAKSSRFTSLLAETKEPKADLSAVKYALLIRAVNYGQ